MSEINADLIHVILVEHARIEHGELANTGYLAVKIAEALEAELPKAILGPTLLRKAVTLMPQPLRPVRAPEER